MNRPDLHSFPLPFSLAEFGFLLWHISIQQQLKATQLYSVVRRSSTQFSYNNSFGLLSFTTAAAAAASAAIAAAPTASVAAILS